MRVPHLATTRRRAVTLAVTAALAAPMATAATLPAGAVETREAQSTASDARVEPALDSARDTGSIESAARKRTYVLRRVSLLLFRTPLRFKVVSQGRDHMHLRDPKSCRGGVCDEIHVNTWDRHSAARRGLNTPTFLVWDGIGEDCFRVREVASKNTVKIAYQKKVNFGAATASRCLHPSAYAGTWYTWSFLHPDYRTAQYDFAYRTARPTSEANAIASSMRLHWPPQG